jgi:hypothetical protein
MTIDRKFVYAFVAGCAFAWWMNSGAAPLPTPFNPTPQNDRPVLRWVAKAAKTALWFMLIAEPAPEQRDARMVQTVIGDDGYPVIDHARAF